MQSPRINWGLVAFFVFMALFGALFAGISLSVTPSSFPLELVLLVAPLFALVEYFQLRWAAPRDYVLPAITLSGLFLNKAPLSRSFFKGLAGCGATVGIFIVGLLGYPDALRLAAFCLIISLSLLSVTFLTWKYQAAFLRLPALPSE